jgi:hypothetical protein
MGQTAKIIIFCSICPGMEITQLKVFNRKKNLEDLEKNLEKLN